MDSAHKDLYGSYTGVYIIKNDTSPGEMFFENTGGKLNI